MLKRTGNKPKSEATPLFNEEEIEKILSKNDCKNRIPDHKIIQEKYQEAKKNKCLIKIISHRNLLNKIESSKERL